MTLAVFAGCSLVADVALFNSQFNRDSFLDNVESFLHTMPDCRPKGLRDRLMSKCRVLYYPVQFVDATPTRYQSSMRDTAGCGGTAARLTVNTCSHVADSSVHTVSTVFDADSHADIADSRADSCADTDDVLCLPASLPVHSEPLHIVWPHRWYVRCLSPLYTD